MNVECYYCQLFNFFIVCYLIIVTCIRNYNYAGDNKIRSIYPFLINQNVSCIHCILFIQVTVPHGTDTVKSQTNGKTGMGKSRLSK